MPPHARFTVVIHPRFPKELKAIERLDASTRGMSNLFYIAPSIFFGAMKAIVEVRKDGKWYVATDLITHVADQGTTRPQAVKNLLKGLREHYEVLFELAPRKKGTRVVEVEV